MILVLIAALLAAILVLLAITVRSGLPAQVRRTQEERDELTQAIHQWAFSTAYVGADREAEDRRLYAVAQEMAERTGYVHEEARGRTLPGVAP